MIARRPGLCLASQDIRDKISRGTLIPGAKNLARVDKKQGEKKKGWFVDDSLEDRVQPSSYEPVIEDTLFVLDTDTNGILRPAPGETVRRALLRIPKRQRQQVDAAHGYELKTGFSYLIPLADRLVLGEKEHVVSSPKSSRGRLFPNTRLLTDFNPAFNEVDGSYAPLEELRLWLLVQPTTFNLVVHPGQTLNQLRFFTSHTDIQLTDAQLAREIERSPILYAKAPDGKLIPLSPSQHVIKGGLRLHLDAEGLSSSGIMSLRARKNPTPIDLSKKDYYAPEDFFEPEVAAEGRLLIDEHARLIVSAEYIVMPRNLSAELERHSDLGMSGSLHDAGFVDNGFEGDLVFELRPDELTRMSLRHGTPLSNLKFFRTTRIPDKIYGTAIGSSYHGQKGPRVSNNFKAFDFKRAAKEYKKLNRRIITQDAEELLKLRTMPEGFEFVTEADIPKIIGASSRGLVHYRYDCEDDGLVLQPIPYVLIFDSKKRIFTYVRAENLRDYGDVRLFGKHSIGVGGHVQESDAPDYIEHCLSRELQEEIKISGEISRPMMMGTLFVRYNPVDRVHFGLVYAVHTTGRVSPKESALISGKMIPIETLMASPESKQRYEKWSQILIPSLEAIYNLSRPGKR